MYVASKYLNFRYFVLFTGALLLQLWSKNLKHACGNRGYLVLVMKVRWVLWQLLTPLFMS